MRTSRWSAVGYPLLWHFRSFYPIVRKVRFDLGSLVDWILSSQTSLWYYFSRCCSVLLRSSEFELSRKRFRDAFECRCSCQCGKHTLTYSPHLGSGLKNQPPRNPGRHANISDFRLGSLRESFQHLKSMLCPLSEARGGCATSWDDPATHGEEGAWLRKLRKELSTVPCESGNLRKGPTC